MKTFRRTGIYRNRFQYWYPWGVSAPWLPRIEWGSDEYCNPSITLIGPLTGALILFYRRGPLRTPTDGKCGECRALEGED